MTTLERWLTPEKQAIAILVVTALSLVSLGMALWMSITHTADAAARKAAFQSNCAVWKYMSSVSPPPTTERGVKLMYEAQRYYNEFECDEVYVP